MNIHIVSNNSNKFKNQDRNWLENEQYGVSIEKSKQDHNLPFFSPTDQSVALETFAQQTSQTFFCLF